MRKQIITTLSVLAVVLASTAASGAAASNSKEGKLGFYGIGGRIGYVSPENIDGTVSFSAVADIGEIRDNIRLYPSISHWSGSWSQNLGFLGFYDYGISQIGLQLDSRYYFNDEASTRFYVGSGGGLFLHNVSIEDSQGNEIDAFGGYESTTSFGLNLMAGLDLPLSGGSTLLGELRYTLVDTWSTIGLNVGVNFELSN